MYTIDLSENADKQLRKLPEQVQIRILSTLDRIKIRPYSFVKRIIGTSYFRLRVGEYRVIIEIKDDRLLIFVIELGHRKNIYKF